MNYIEKDLSYYIDLLKQKPFSLARYGDAEWLHLMGRRKPDQVTGGSHHHFFPELGKDLHKTIFTPILTDNYIYATHRSAMHRIIKEYMDQNDTGIKWYEGDRIFHNPIRHGKLFPLIKHLRTTKNMIVGPNNLRKIEKEIIPYTHFVEIPTTDCYLEKEKIKDNILKSCYDNCIIFISGSLTGKVLVYELYPEIGHKCFIIDIGSIWEILLDHPMRYYWRMLKKNKPKQYRRILDLNLGKVNGCNS